MQVVPLEPARRLRGDGGTVIVEAAFFMPIFLYLLMGIIEFGMYFRNYLTLDAGVTDGARVLAILGNADETDFQALQVIKKSMGGIARGDIVNIVIFDPTNLAAGATSQVNPIDATVPSSCSSITSQGGVTGLCNVYTTGTAWAPSANKTDYQCTGAGANYSKYYCPTNRVVAKTATTTKDNAGNTFTKPAGGTITGPCFVGIYIGLRHKFATGLFGSSRLLSQTIITRCEPQSLT